MLIGDFLWEFVCIAVIISAALSVVLIRYRVSKNQDTVSTRLWIRFSLVLFVLCVVGLVEGFLLSPYGFGWFVLAIGVTLCVVARFLPRFMRLDRWAFAGDAIHCS
jgi:ABC-type xylose transport system permease subunit